MNAPDESTYWCRGLSLLDYNNYISLNRTLIKVLGLNAAVLACELVSEARYWLGRGQLVNGWFFSTVDNITENCGLSKYYQSEALKILQEFSIVEVNYKGMPRKRYVRVSAVRIMDIIDAAESSTEWTTSRQQSGPLVVNRVDDNKYIYGNGTGEEELQVNSSSSKFDFLVSRGFAPPTVDEVRTYCQANGFNYCDPEDFIDYYSSQNWLKPNGLQIVDWRPLVRSWSKNSQLKSATEKAARRKADYTDLDEGWATG